MKHLYSLLIFYILLFSITANAQIVSDNFTDGDFSANPTWTGDTGEFIVNASNQLQSNGPSATATLHLATPNTAADEVSWEFWTNIDTAPSSSNFARVYLMSDQANLEGDLNGYYIELGESGSADAIELYKQVGSTRTEIFSLGDGAISAAFTARIKVTRTTAGLWTISADMTGGSTFVALGSVTDNTTTTTSFFGFYVKHSSTKKDKYSFDEVIIDNLPDLTAPKIESISVLDENTIEVFFDEDVAQTSAETLTNYSVNNSIGNPTTAQRDGTNNKKVTLDFASNFTDEQENILTITNVKDLSANAITSVTKAFTYFAPDLVAPVITQISVVSLNSIYVVFDEIVAQNIAETESNYTLNNSIGNPTTAARDATNQNKILLTFAADFVIGTDYTVSVQNIEDAFGNAIAGTLNQTFTFTDILAPTISQLSVISSSALDVYFDENVEQTTSQTAANYTKDNGTPNPVSAIRDAADLNLVHLFFSDNFSENSDITLTVNNVTDALGNATSNIQAVFQYDTKRPTVCDTCVVAISANELEVFFSEKVNKTTAQIINNYEVTALADGFADIGFPTSATLQANDSTVRLVFDADFAQEIQYNTRVTKVQDFSENVMITRNRKFIYDVTPPAITSLTLLSNDTIQLTFSEVVEQTTAETITNYSVDNAIGNPTSATLFQGNPKIVKLYFAAGLGNSEANILTTENVTDLKGNIITSQNSNFTTLAPTIGKVTVISKTKLHVLFSEQITTTSAQVLTNYSVFDIIGNPITATQDETNQAVVILEFATEFQTNIEYFLSTNNIEDLNGNISETLTEGFTYSSSISAVNVISANLLDVVFTSSPLQSDAENESRYSLNNSVGNPVSAIQDADDNTMIHLAFTDIPTEINLTLTLGTFDLQNGETAPISIFDFLIDVTPPSIAKAEVIDLNKIEIYFSEDVEEITAEALNHYSLDNSVGEPQTVFLNSENDSLVTLIFASDLVLGTNYTLTVTNIQDLNGLELSSEQVAIARPTPPSFGQLIISEIFADPTPIIGLPEAEFIEIYNASATETFSLAGLRLEDGTAATILGSFDLLPNSYVILTTNAAVADFQSFGNVLGVTSFPSLSNTGELLQLKTQDGDLIHSVNYATSWYKDALKADGGYSLEIIDPENTCSEIENWTASTSALGGTPGIVNAVNTANPDISAPTITQINIVSNTKIEIIFSEKMDTSAVFTNAENYVIDNSVTVSQVSKTDIKTVQLTLNSALSESILYELTVSNTTDCAGNSVNPNNYNFGIGVTPSADELIISEIFADETPKIGLPLVEYLEVYNRSTKLLNLENLQLTDATGLAILEKKLLLPNQYLVLTSKADSFPTVEVLQVSGFPSLNNSGELVSIKTENGTVINSVNYATSWYKDALKDDGGYSLEIIDPENTCSEIENWIASTSDLGGTPGIMNAVNAANPDISAPTITEINIVSNTEIEIIFSEKMDTSAVFTNAENYVIDNSVTVSAVSKTNTTTVQLTLNSALSESILYELTVLNSTDCAGNSVNPSSYNFGVGVTPSADELIISEIFADETPKIGLPLVEYLEIYNRSTKLLNLENLQLTDATGLAILEKRLLLPNQYLVLTSKADSFPTVDVLQVSGFPSLNNSGEFLSIKTENGTVINSVNYATSWYKDDIKDNGGYSLEIIDPENTCSEIENWIASNSSTGGTPGMVNAVNTSNPDIIAPIITQINIVSNTEIEIICSEKMDTSAVFTDTANYVIDNSVFVHNVNKIGLNKVIVAFSPALEVGALYNITISNITDCAGNPLDNSPIEFGMQAIADFNDIVISEIFADVSPVVGLPEIEFIEIYNRTDKVFSLGGFTIEDATGIATLPMSVILPQEYVILTLSSGVDDYDVFGKTIAVSNWRSLSSSGEQLTLRNNLGQLVFEVFYKDDFYQDIDKEDGGYTLEMIDTNNPCLVDGNWRASNDAKGGTPGKENSVKGSIQDNTAPKLIRVDVIDEQNLRLVFDEKLDSLSVTNASYSIDNGISVAKVNFVIPQTSNVFLELDADLVENTTYTITVNSFQDCASNTMATDNSVVFVLPSEAEVGDIILNEILFNPPTDGTDFVELYNNSDKYINVQNWQMATLDSGGEPTTFKVITTDILILAPSSYLVLNENNSSLKNQYPDGKEETFLEMDLPTFADSEGSVLLYNNANEPILMEQFDYDDKLHFALLDDKEGISLERISLTAPTNDANNWKSASSNSNFGTPGYLNSQNSNNTSPTTFADAFNLSTQIFTPDQDGFNDFVEISYQGDAIGSSVNITIYDVKGRIVRNLVQGETLSTAGFYQWDGLNNQNQKVGIGYYILFIETFDLSGNVNKTKKTVAVGRGF